MSQYKIVFFSDERHGWGRVLRSTIKELGLADKISGYSYQNMGFVYLEEDCDLPLFIQALHSAGIDEDLVFQDPVENSGIRNLARYAA